jgi:hypothetical protein
MISSYGSTKKASINESKSPIQALRFLFHPSSGHLNAQPDSGKHGAWVGDSLSRDIKRRSVGRRRQYNRQAGAYGDSSLESQKL